VANGVDPERGVFVRAYGRRDLDAALLVLPLLGVEPPDSPRTVATIDAVRRQLSAGGPLLYRYPPGDDGLAGGEGAFLPCSFWLAQALAASGSVDEATEVMDELLGLAGPLGLFAEEADPEPASCSATTRRRSPTPPLVQAPLAIRDAIPARTHAATTGRAATPAPSRTRRGRPS
jgi:GH15 family glucan-1,4-alpha-glucosidase